MLGVKPPAHPSVLRTLPCENKRGPDLLSGPSHPGTSRLAGLGKLAENRRRFLRLTRHHAQTFSKGYAACPGRPNRRWPIRDRQLAQPRGKRLGLAAQRLGCAGAQHQQLRMGCRVFRWRRHLRRSLGKNNVRIRADKTKSTHPRHPAALPTAPRLQLIHHPQRRVFPVDMRARLGEIEVRRQCLAPERLDDLEAARHAGGRLQVPQIRLYRSDAERAARGPTLREHFAQRVDLDGIAQRRRGAVGLDVIDVLRSESRCLQRTADNLLLRRSAGDREAARAAVLIDRRAQNQCEDRVACRLSVAQAFQDQRAAALAARVALRPGIEGVALAVRCEQAGLLEIQRQIGTEDSVHARRQRHLTLAAAQALHGEVNRDQRGRARGVDHHRGAVEFEIVREPPRRRALGRAGAEVGIDLRAIGGREEFERVVDPAHPDKYSDLSAGPCIGPDVARFKRMPRQLQQQALLRVHALRLFRRDAEKRGVKLIRALEIRAEAARRPLGPVWGRGLDGRAARRQKIPISLRVRALPGKLARHADDGNRLTAQRFERLVLLLQAAEFPERLGQQIFGVVSHGSLLARSS